MKNYTKGNTMNQNKNAFTMIELVFVIVVLGILAAVAVPKFAATRTDAQIAKGRADVASIRSSIITERQSRLIKGDSSYINKLHSSTTSYFDGNGTAGINLLMYGVTPEDANGHWKTGAACAGTPSVCTYTIMLDSISVAFTYTPADGKFTCATANATYGEMCKQLIN